MKTRDSYHVFIKTLNNKIKYYSDELHFSIGMCSTFYTAICNSKNEKVVNYFKEIGFLAQCPPITEFGVFSEDNISIELQSTIHLYRNYVVYRIPYFKTMLDNYIFISSIPYEIYNNIIGLYNSELSKLILKGERVVLSKIGVLDIKCETKRSKKKILDFKQTKINKERFKENNIEGDYRVYNNNDEFLIYVLLKNPCHRALRYYHFEPTNYNNMIDRKIENYYKLDKTEDSILNNTKIGNVQKMNALSKHNLKYKLKYIQNAT